MGAVPDCKDMEEWRCYSAQQPVAKCGGKYAGTSRKGCLRGGFFNNGGNDMTAYWKNGLPIPLTDTVIDARANSIAASGNDVYVGGYQDVSGNATASKPVYWKNGTPSLLPVTPGNTSYVKAIALAGNNLLIPDTQRLSIQEVIPLLLGSRGQASRDRPVEQAADRPFSSIAPMFMLPEKSRAVTIILATTI